MVRRQRQYYEHLSRHTMSWPARLLKVHKPEFLQEQRRSHWATLPLSARSLLSSRTGTRACRQKIATRYAEGLLAHTPSLAKLPPLGEGEPVERVQMLLQNEIMVQIEALRSNIASWTNLVAESLVGGSVPKMAG